MMARLIVSFDMLVVGYAFMFAYSFRNSIPMDMGPLVPLPKYLPYAISSVPIWGLLSYFVGLYASQRMKRPAAELLQILKVGISFFASLTIIAFVFKLHFVARSFIILYVVSATVFVMIAHLILRFVLRYYRRRGRNFRTIAIAGCGDSAREMAEVVLGHSEWGLRFGGYVLPDDAAPDSRCEPCLGRLGGLDTILRSNVIDEVIFAMPRERLEDLEDAFLLCEELGVNSRLMLNIFPYRISRAEVEEIEGISMLSFSNTPGNLIALGAKRAFDATASLCALAVLGPLMLAAAVAIKVTSPGPVFFRQVRCGRNGREFDLLKFRSMVADAERLRGSLEHLNEMDGPVFKIQNDPRITAVGRFIRKTSIDELPQFINVLVGDMSVVGPRPPIPSEVAQYKHWQRRRLSVKPGITCYWQISGRNKVDFESWMRLDLKYIDNWSLVEDFKIILKTIPVVLIGRGAS